MTNESGKKPVLHKKHVARLEREQRQTRIVLYSFFGIIAVVALLLLYGWLDVAVLQLNRPVAKVGDTEILVKDLEPRIRLRRQQLLDNYNQYQQYAQYFGMDVTSQLQQIEAQLNDPTSVGQTVLDELIDEELIRQEAAKRGITVSEEELNAEVEAGFGYFPNGTPTPTLTATQVVMPDNPESIFDLVTATLEPTATPQFSPTPESTATATAQPVENTPGEGTNTAEPTATFTASPTATATLPPTTTPTAGPTATPFPTSTPITEEGFQGMLDKTNTNLAKYGFSADYYRDFFESQILRRKLQEVITAEVKPTQEQVWARHILVADEATAKDIIAKLQDGGDFAELAREFSTDGSASTGGDLGWFGKGAMVPEFETAAFALKNPGDFTTEPVQSQFGYHIIQLIAKQDRPLSADEYQTAKDTAFSDWLTSAREEYGVETFDVWQQRAPTEPNFITIATEAVEAQKTAQAEQLSTLEAANDVTETPQP
ncbi:MAG TPA: peptidylprolyl isomerase [Anaerolineales bacterium]|nr:peptidylprolyl isomerase [Anaerolineales bacterium]